MKTVQRQGRDPIDVTTTLAGIYHGLCLMRQNDEERVLRYDESTYVQLPKLDII